ncbi:11002_t:CDS:1 [Acaulospora colombiana]|uniref:11002_t:CDS:1 n=1 Tax=Acaulospora colombiana TaxID=27376 RepID=A0ACA9KDG6_9GLOM|nr:11002_t:CDS:1 [Acaulospora colombiana]
MPVTADSELNDASPNIDLEEYEKILTRFLKYPTSEVKDATLCRAVEEIRLQSRNFKALTKSSISNSVKAAQSAKYIITDLRKFQHGELDFDDTLAATEVRVTNIMEKCNLLRQGYTDITNSFYKISESLRIRNSEIQSTLYEIRTKELKDKVKATKTGTLTGLGIGTMAAIPIATCMSLVDGGVTLAATLITGGIIGFILSKGDHNKSGHKETMYAILRKDHESIKSIINDIDGFQSGVRVFEEFWKIHFDRISDSRQKIFGSRRGHHKWDGPTVQSMLKYWTLAEKVFENYGKSIIMLDMK